MAKKITKKRLLYLILIALAFVAIYLLGNRIDSTAIANTVRKAGIFGPIVYIILLGSTFVFAPVSGSPAIFAGYILFGKNFQILVYLSAVLGMAVNFWIAKLWGRRLVIKLVGESNMDKVDEFTKEHGIKSLILLRLFQGNLLDFISYGFGLTKMKFLPYILVSVVTPLPYLFIWQFYISNRIKDLSDMTFWYIVTAIPFIVLSGFLYAKYRKKKQKLPNP
ncbi:MAG TPA: VTT domain-containing protein [Patescibacteria group bacterium]|nr:VTT domain-containing protein [Patescibacteria group bacterium]